MFWVFGLGGGTFALHAEEVLQLKVFVACRGHFVQIGLGSGGCVRELVFLSCRV